MSALADLTRRLDELAIELRQLAHRRLSAPRDAAGAIDQLIDAKSREAAVRESRPSEIFVCF
jgi:hypothetical protein